MSEEKRPTFEIKIQPVSVDEFEELSELASRSFSDAFGHALTQAELEESLAETRSVAYFEKTFAGSTILVAKQNDKIVGYVQYGTVKIPELDAHENDRELGRLYVETGLHGQGIGGQLMDAALNDPEMRRAPNIFLQVWEENPKAISLYESYNFEKCGITTFELAGKPAQDLIMVRRQT